MNIEFSDPVKYSLTLSGKSIKKHKIFETDKYKSIKSFKKPVTKDKTFKVYIVKHNQKIIYVGITSQSIGKRIGQGFRAKGEKGYYGYHWKKIEGQVEILIWVSDLKHNKRKGKVYKEKLHLMEGIEGEIVFMFREENEYWPEWQNEIHFHNVDKKYKDLAKMIYHKSK